MIREAYWCGPLSTHRIPPGEYSDGRSLFICEFTGRTQRFMVFCAQHIVAVGYQSSRGRNEVK